ncbi:YciI family protein [Trinickia fusca]|uniref:GTP cyclohydrolase n=1 Tax=Trinickia fusca TaxID=2419777 RepID=A0A494XLX4_9BURK|nr:YciI family protein [Trinickia fusca]RKP49119.1 GTP cyclohydrolase [Trinickia fusca]
MFIVMLHYLQPIPVVEQHVEQHRAFLDRHYAAGHFIASGPQVPRIGGVILAQGLTREALDQVLAEDPFYREGVAQYQVVEFVPRKFAPALAPLFAAEQ